MTRTLAFIVNGDETYGISRFTAAVLEKWVRSGIKCEVFSLADGPMAELCRAAGAEVDIQKVTQPPDYGRGGMEAVNAAIKMATRSLQGAVQIAAWLKRREPNAVVVRSPNIVPMTGLAARRAGVKSFWIMPNGVSSRYPLNLNKRIYDVFFRLTGMTPIANSAYTKATLLNQLVEAKYLHLGIDSAAFDPSRVQPADRAAFGLEPHHAVAGVFARITPEKGQLELIRALASLRDDYPDLHLIVGGGPMDSPFGQTLIAVARELKLNDRVHFPGPRADVRGLNLMCDFVINSRLTPEPFGLSVIEGMMLGRPVLAHRAGGPGETIIDGETGWLIDDPSVPGFAAGLARVMRDRARWVRMGTIARAHAIAHFDISISADRLLEIFELEHE